MVDSVSDRPLGEAMSQGQSPAKPRGAMSQALRFLLVGLVSSACYTGTTMVLSDFGILDHVASSVVGFVLGTLASWLLNSLWTFSAQLHGKLLLRFVTVTLVGLGLNVLIMACVEAMGVNYRLGLLTVLILVPIFNFCCHRWWTFRGGFA
jgi:putative flippase GtrA